MNLIDAGIIYLCILATAGLILKAWQLFGSPKNIKRGKTK